MSTADAGAIMQRIRRASHFVQTLQCHDTIQVVDEELVLIVVLACIKGLCILVIVIVIKRWLRKNGLKLWRYGLWRVADSRCN